MHFQPHAWEKSRRLTLPRTHSLWKYRGGERDLCPWGQIETSYPACKKGQRLKMSHEASYFGTSWLFTDHANVSSDTTTCSYVMLQKTSAEEELSWVLYVQGRWKVSPPCCVFFHSRWRSCFTSASSLGSATCREPSWTSLWSPVTRLRLLLQPQSVTHLNCQRSTFETLQQIWCHVAFKVLACT